jgi:hypothetical protein
MRLDNLAADPQAFQAKLYESVRPQYCNKRLVSSRNQPNVTDAPATTDPSFEYALVMTTLSSALA